MWDTFKQQKEQSLHRRNRFRNWSLCGAAAAEERSCQQSFNTKTSFTVRQSSWKKSSVLTSPSERRTRRCGWMSFWKKKKKGKKHMTWLLMRRNEVWWWKAQVEMERTWISQETTHEFLLFERSIVGECGKKWLIQGSSPEMVRALGPQTPAGSMCDSSNWNTKPLLQSFVLFFMSDHTDTLTPTKPCVVFWVERGQVDWGWGGGCPRVGFAHSLCADRGENSMWTDITVLPKWAETCLVIVSVRHVSNSESHLTHDNEHHSFVSWSFIQNQPNLPVWFDVTLVERLLI